MDKNTKKHIGELTIGVNIEGYDKTKQQLRNLEATYDRILEKQERIGKGINANDHELLQRIDNDCGRIVRMLRGYSTKDMDSIAEKYEGQRCFDLANTKDGEVVIPIDKHNNGSKIIKEIDDVGKTIAAKDTAKKDNMMKTIAHLYNLPLEVIKYADKAGAYEDLVIGFRAKLRDGTIIKFGD